MAARKLALMFDPPIDRLITRAPASTARLIPAAIESSVNLHPEAGLLAVWVAQLPGESIRSAWIVASKAIPRIPLPLRAAAAINAIWVP